MHNRTCLIFATTCLLSGVALAADDNQLLIGGGLAVEARYAGSDRNTAAPVVVLDYSHASGFFVSTLRGVGYGGQDGPFSYSAALGYRGERKDKDERSLFGNTGSDELKGMGDIKGNPSAVLSVGFKPLSRLELTVSADLPLSRRENGKTLHTGIAAQLLSGGTDHVSLALTAGFADGKYLQTYHGVSASQAATSGFSAYRPKAGLYEASTMLTWEHTFNPRWSATTLIGATQLLRDASRSPLTKRKTNPTAGFYVTYAY
ncbi:MipA/OmpV family protein [Duganella sp. FT50W]|uniref:MipA/OmpV family protein n=1 Tax=Duganella lactea TaxID=2692173 RepID=A0A6L8MMK5_9BURK|nr:MipA/OmpV family protein [Duganella lactea]MYM84410.1 MipA/OmpV family protein [Duganella lactea]